MAIDFKHVPHPRIAQRKKTGAPKPTDEKVGFTGKIALTLPTDVEGGATPTLSHPLGSWSPDGTTYTVAYAVADQEVDIRNISVDVTGARDAAGNDQVAYTSPPAFNIDTLDPHVVAVTAQPAALISDATAGTQTFSLAVQFSEPMNTAATPVLRTVSRRFPTSRAT